MNVVVVCGDDTLKARRRFAQIVSAVKKKGWQTVNIHAKDELAISDRLISSSLFPAQVLFVVDGVKKLSSTDLSWIKKNIDKYEGSLLVYAGGPLPAAIKNALPKLAKIEKFDVPKIIWSFLDSFYPGNLRNSLRLFEELVESEPVELVVAILARHLRDLVWVAEGGEGMELPAWRAGKLRAQAARFTKDSLRDTINALAEIDYKSKTSGANTVLLLEMLIVEQLE